MGVSVRVGKSPLVTGEPSPAGTFFTPSYSPSPHCGGGQGGALPTCRGGQGGALPPGARCPFRDATGQRNGRWEGRVGPSMPSKTVKNLPIDWGGMVEVKKKSRSPTQFARHLRKNPTDAEQRLWQHLRLKQANGHKFRRQQPIGPYIADFVCFERSVIVEVDGGQHAESRFEDSNRTTWLQAQGFHVLRFWNHEVLTDPDAVLRVIMQALIRTPSPTKGRG